MHNNCTITTDIGLDTKLQVATYAFWISTNHGYFTMTGILKTKTNSSFTKVGDPVKIWKEEV